MFSLVPFAVPVILSVSLKGMNLRYKIFEVWVSLLIRIYSNVDLAKSTKKFFPTCKHADTHKEKAPCWSSRGFLIRVFRKCA